jgi:hypothetical protein
VNSLSLTEGTAVECGKTRSWVGGEVEAFASARVRWERNFSLQNVLFGRGLVWRGSLIRPNLMVLIFPIFGGV